MSKYSEDDIIGGRFGILLVKGLSSKRNKRKERLWVCRCDCGREHLVKTSNLISGRTKSCGCRKRGPPRDDSEVGKKIGIFEVLRFSHTDKHREALYECQCTKCGETGLVRRSKLCKVKSCKGCRWDDYKEISHGYWSSIRKGAKVRSIVFSLTRQEVWEQFLEQDRRCALSGVSLRFARGYTGEQTASLDRIDNNKGYEVENVQWVHKEINEMKMCRSNEDFIKWCKLVAEEQIK